ncbi:IucA/IucC family C-terminal-domain containing protein [Streptomyces sp. NPDC050504]|uniref:IucA/IucC family C-terminal-domain containing protein n=1 Tax=Streptomyces sp. NPDC050504 TaxID=3365618 RepID=UPI0037B97F4B
MDLVELTSVGGFFALRTGGADAGRTTLAEVYEGGSAALRDRVAKVAGRTGAPEWRVAASIAHLGLAARLWSVALGSAALYGALPDLDPARLRWDPDATSPDDLFLVGSAAGGGAARDGAPGGVPEAPEVPATVEALREGVQDRHLVPLARALRHEGNISERLLWGNAGSALAAAVGQLRTWARDHDRPEAGRRAAQLAHGLFAHPDLNATGSLRAGAFRRNSCCLYYRCPKGGLCGDCAFDTPPGGPAR